MNVDWFTIIAQVINFIILLWLMKRFLYKPILHAIDKREKRIAEELANAEIQQGAAEKLKREYEQKKEELNQQRTGFLKKAQDEADAEKLRLLKEAREAAEALRAKRQEEFIAEEKNLHETVSRKIQNEVLATTRKILTDLAGADLDDQVVGVFNRRLRNLTASEIESLTSALETQPGTVAVRTAFEISPELRKSTEASIKEIVGSHVNVTFESAPDLINGIELSVNGQKVAWSVADYLSSFEVSSTEEIR